MGRALKALGQNTDNSMGRQPLAAISGHRETAAAESRSNSLSKVLVKNRPDQQPKSCLQHILNEQDEAISSQLAQTKGTLARLRDFQGARLENDGKIEKIIDGYRSFRRQA